MGRLLCLRPSIHRLAARMGSIWRSHASGETNRLQLRRLRSAMSSCSYPRPDLATKNRHGRLYWFGVRDNSRRIYKPGIQMATFKSVFGRPELINNAAHWNYQRIIFSPVGAAKERTIKRIRSRRRVRKAEIRSVPSLNVLPEMRKTRAQKVLYSQTVRDLVFSRGSVKRKVCELRISNLQLSKLRACV